MREGLAYGWMSLSGFVLAVGAFTLGNMQTETKTVCLGSAFKCEAVTTSGGGGFLFIVGMVLTVAACVNFFKWVGGRG